MQGSQRLAVPLLAFLFGVVTIGIVFAWSWSPRQGGPMASGIGGPFSLTAQDGRVVTEASLTGSPTLIFFGFTHCPDVCPTALFEISQVYEALGPKADRLKTYFITVDPERDRPDVLATYLSSFDPRITGLTGSAEAVRAALKAYRGYAKKVELEGGGYTMDHTALVYLLDRKGRFVSSVNLGLPPAETARAIAAYF
jgi:protein SCO1/2